MLRFSLRFLVTGISAVVIMVGTYGVASASTDHGLKTRQDGLRDRIEAARTANQEDVPSTLKAPKDTLAQWYNWPNWNNFQNWSNWRNW